MRGDPIYNTAGEEYEAEFTKNNDVLSTAYMRAQLLDNPLAWAAWYGKYAYKKYIIHDPQGAQAILDARKTLKDRFDFLREHDQVGAGAGTRHMAGAALGFLVDPTSAAGMVSGSVHAVIGAASEQTAKALGEWTATKALLGADAAKTAGKIAGAGAGGFTAGALYSLPTSLTQLAMAHTAFHEDFDSLDLIKSTFENGCFGALVSGGGSLLWHFTPDPWKQAVVKVFSPRRVRQAMSAADTQASVGTHVDMTDYLQQAFNEARTDGSDLERMADGKVRPMTETITDAQSAARGKVDDMSAEIKERTDRVNKMWDKLPQRLRERPLTTYEVAKRLDMQRFKGDEELSALDKSLRDKYAATPYTTLREVQDMLDNPLHYDLMQDKSRAFFDDILSYKEQEHLIADTGRLMGTVGDEEEAGSPTRLEGRKMSDRWKILDKAEQLGRNEMRINELDSIEGERGKMVKHDVYEPTFDRTLSVSRPKVLAQLLREHDAIDDLVRKRAGILDSIEEGDSLKEILRTQPTPMTPRDVLGKMSAHFSPENDAALPKDVKRYEPAPEEQLAPYEPPEVKLEDMPDEAREFYAQKDAILADERNDLPTWRKIYDELANCLRGGL